MSSNNTLKGAYGDLKPLGLPVDQQHSASKPGATRADLVPPPAPKETSK